MRKEWAKVTIGDRLYTFKDMSAETQFFMSLKVAEAFGGVFSSVIPLLGMEASGAIAKGGILAVLGVIDLKEIESSLSSALGKVNPNKIKPVVDELMPYWFVCPPESGQGTTCTYDDFGNGKLSDLYKVLIRCLRYYFADFFQGLLSDGKAEGEEQDV